MDSASNRICAVYARVSTHDGRQDTANQLLDLRAYAERCGWRLTREYVDELSGAKRSQDRPQLDRLLTDASRKLFDVLLVWSLDRFTREGVGPTFRYIESLDNYGIEFHSYTEPHFRTAGPAGPIVIAIAAWIAQFERTRQRDRIRAGIARTKAAGTKLGRPRRDIQPGELAELVRLWTGDPARRTRPHSFTELEKKTGIPRATIARKIHDYVHTTKEQTT